MVGCRVCLDGVARTLWLSFCLLLPPPPSLPLVMTMMMMMKQVFEGESSLLV